MRDRSQELEQFRERVRGLSTEELIALAELLQKRGSVAEEEMSILNAEIAIDRVKNQEEDG